MKGIQRKSPGWRVWNRAGGQLALVLPLIWWPTVWADPPTLDHLFPAGLQRGSTATITCRGQFSWPVKVWAVGANVEVTEQEGQLSVSIPSNLQTDRIWVRLYNDDGASQAVPLLVGSLTETNEVEPNDQPRAAQQLSQLFSPPADAQLTINGVLEKQNEVDGFAVQLEAGQTLVAAVAANSYFGATMDAVLQVVTPAGELLIDNHDDVGLDPRLAFTADESGTYIVRLFAFPSQPNQKIAFHGGDSYIYRLTLTTGPYITHTNPSVVDLNSADAVGVMGWNMPTGARLAAEVLGQGHLGLQTESEPRSPVTTGTQIGLLRAPGWAGSARVRMVRHGVGTTMAETSQHHPQQVTPPASVCGCIDEVNGIDYFRLPLRKDQHYTIAVESLSLDSHLVPLVQMRDSNGKVAAEVTERGPAKDVNITHKAEQDGNYLLSITDRYRHGGDRYFYRMTVLAQNADYALRLDSDRVVLAGNEADLEIPVNVDRFPGSGPEVGEITVQATGLPTGVSCAPAISKPEGDTAKKVTLKLKSDGTSRFSGNIRISGQSESDMERFATTPVSYKACFDRLWLTVTAADEEQTDEEQTETNTSEARVSRR